MSTARTGNGGGATAVWGGEFVTAGDNHEKRAFDQSLPRLAAVSRKRLWSGRIISALPILFLLFDAAIKFMNVAPVAEAQSQLGIPPNLTLSIGILELACVAVYLIPGASILGAILLTGYLGGAIAIHVRVANPLLTHVLFPAYVAVFLWGGLYLRDPRLRYLVSRRNGPAAVERARGNMHAASFVSRRTNVALWSIQVLLALLFLFAGGMKLILSPEALASMGSPDQIALPGWFIRFIGVSEVLGAFGMILPGLFRICLGLTPLAATGLVIIMIGATSLTLAAGQIGPAFIPLVVGLMASFVAYGRWNRLKN